MTTEIKVRTWIWVTFATVVVLGGGFTYWNMKGNKSTVSPTISPTPTIISKVSPSASAKTTATPTGERTATYSSNPTATPANSFSGSINANNTSYKITFTKPQGFEVKENSNQIELAQNGKTLITLSNYENWCGNAEEVAHRHIRAVNKNAYFDPYTIYSELKSIEVDGKDAAQWTWGQSQTKYKDTIIKYKSESDPNCNDSLFILGDIGNGLSENDYDSILSSLKIT